MLCESSVSVTKKLKLLIVTGSELNLIKINCLNEELLVDKYKKIFLKGINKYLIGKIMIPIVIDNVIKNLKFHRANYYLNSWRQHYNLIYKSHLKTLILVFNFLGFIILNNAK